MAKADKIQSLFQEAFTEFLAREGKNILSGVSERNLCGCLAQCMEKLTAKYRLQSYRADVEYNRNDGRVKTILNEQAKVVTINCDLILHSRGKFPGKDNLIAVEMKKSNRPDNDKESDRERLRVLTRSSYDGIWAADGKSHPEHVCGYELGYYLELDLNTREIRIEEYRKGNLVAKSRKEIRA